MVNGGRMVEYEIGGVERQDGGKVNELVLPTPLSHACARASEQAIESSGARERMGQRA